MRVQYAVALISCNKYRQINYQLPNEAISRSMTLPRALALCAVSPKTKLDGREIDRSKPQFASSHAMIWSSRPPKPSGGTAILTLTGNPACNLSGFRGLEPVGGADEKRLERA